jgi:Uma2 family endonuclease
MEEFGTHRLGVCAMADTLVRCLEETIEASQLLVGERPITFKEYLELPDPNHDYELINGVLTKKMSAQLDHERLQMWLNNVINGYVTVRELGEVLGSRSAVEIGIFGGRMPDLLFVRKERMDIVQQKAIYGPPDLVIEIVSPNDRIGGLRSLEADYRNAGVAEIVFIDLRKGEITVLHNKNGDYEVTVVRDGDLALESIAGLTLKAEWILSEPRPIPYATLTELLHP